MLTFRDRCAIAKTLGSKVIDNKIYSCKTAEILDDREQLGGKAWFLFCKSNGELFCVSCETLEGTWGPTSIFFTVGNDFMRKELRYFDADSLPERALKFHGIEE